MPAKIPAACTARIGSAETVANSTVFGGIAGDVMPGWVKANGEFRAPDQEAIAAAIARCEAPLSRKGGDINAIREKLTT